MYAEADDEDDGAGVDEGAEEVVGTAELETDVGLAAAVVDEEGRAVVDGWTYVMDVPAATPVNCQFDLELWLNSWTYSQCHYTGNPADSSRRWRSWDMQCSLQLRCS